MSLVNPAKFLILGFRGLSLEKEFVEFITKFSPAGFLLLGDNFENIPQLKTLISDLKKIAGEKTLVLVDQEPGRVQRLKNEFPLSKLPEEYASESSLDNFRAWCGQTAAMLSAVGVNTNLLPVLDLWPFTKKYPVLDGRSFGDNPDRVIEFATAAIEEFHRAKILVCGKHFPGLGSASGDPHEILARSPDPRDRFLNYHWKPFLAAVKQGIDLVMTTHLLASSFDSDNCATFSKAIIDQLRNYIGFRGPIISDDLYMGGAHQGQSVADAAAKSLVAGHNLLIISRDTALQREIVESLKKRFEDDASFAKIAAVNERAIQSLLRSS